MYTRTVMIPGRSDSAPRTCRKRAGDALYPRGIPAGRKRLVYK
ncbi:hypothetical protein SGL43_06310 [Streptomyces globisporus]|uniref:Uncharacterized protein n=1 Tax=Streptomyces globisporus TaxID=1908 RepID=A0ABN8V996_STRGL|nr:hypothetical protein SGL43_06310 [Streptomyces globisporus]